MTTTARTRKTGKTAPEEAPAQAATPVADSAPAAPDAAPLEPPHVDEAPEPPAPSPYVTPTEVIPDEENLSDVILDDATGQPPASPEAVFVPLTPFGSTLQCTVRLVERTFLGPHHNPVTRLLQPKGAVVSEGIAARIRERLDAQAARTGSDQ
ncbi:hypothetical protein ABZ410_15550 [Streptomyces cinnamoneus]|uniref:hypothetical protein n=1 Tax=Streptomyces cinnamoneus TaxID=53446 RepID=UPI0034032E9B